jgi:hypothetical protein
MRNFVGAVSYKGHRDFSGDMRLLLELLARRERERERERDMQMFE